MPMPYSERFLEILVHDLRSPLNVLKLTLHVLDEMSRQGDSDLADDVKMMRQNIDEIDRMLITLVNYAQLPAEASKLKTTEFDPSRTLRDLVDQLAEDRPRQDVRLELEGGPPTVRLDPALARQAWLRALENTAIAAGNRAPIRVVLRGGPDRCVVEMIVDGPPKDSVVASEILPDGYQRIIGTAAERRGIDLATASQISRLFGGTAKLTVEPGQRAAIVLDWPASAAGAAGA